MNSLPSTVRTSVTSVLLVSLVGQSAALGFEGGHGVSVHPVLVGAAAVSASANSQVLTPQSMSDVHTPLKIAKTARQALIIMKIAEVRPFAAYFEKGGSAEEIGRLNGDVKAVVVARALLGMSDETEKFNTWWAANQTSVLLSKSKMQSATLQEFVASVFLRFKADELGAKKDPGAFVAYLERQVTNPAVIAVSIGTLSLLINTLSAIGNIAKGAAVAGPAAGVMGGLVEPIVRPLREKASIVGSRLFGKFGVWLTNRLFKVDAEKAPSALTELEGDVHAASKGAREAEELLNRMGYDITPAQYADNMKKLQSIWNETNRIWVQTNPSLFKDGRSVFSDAVAGRVQGYSSQIMQGLQGAEQARQAIEQHIDRIISRNGREAAVVEKTVVELLRAVEINKDAAEANREDAKASLAKSSEALKALGATDYQVERIINSRLAELLNVRHVAYALASNVIHELQYEEFNRTLPDEVQKIQRTLREGTTLDYFHNVFKEEVTKIMNTMEFKLSAADEVVKAAKETPQMKAAQAKVAKLTAAEKPAPKETPLAAPRPRVREIVRTQVSRATNALSRLNRVRENAVVIERTGDLRTEKTEKSDRIERVEPVKRAVGH